MKKLIYIIIIILLISAMLISSYFIFKEEKEQIQQEDIFEELIEDTQNNNNQVQEENNVNMQELCLKNNDIVGWIRIDGTNIDYPVMQKIEIKDYYLRKNFYKEYSIMGTPYIAEQCNLKNSDNLIIYGHNISKKRMFGELENYKKKEFYENHKVINFFTMENCEKYEIIYVFKTVAEKGFKYYKYYNLKERGEFETFVKQCSKLSLYDTEQSAEYGDKFITLSTCEYSQENGRLVVVAKRIS